jgi:hypothetical protein
VVQPGRETSSAQAASPLSAARPIVRFWTKTHRPRRQASSGG